MNKDLTDTITYWAMSFMIFLISFVLYFMLKNDNMPNTALIVLWIIAYIGGILSGK